MRDAISFVLECNKGKIRDIHVFQEKIRRFVHSGKKIVSASLNSGKVTCARTKVYRAHFMPGGYNQFV